MIAFILVAIAGICKSVSDRIAHSDSETWRNKWKNGDPLQGEAFPGSSTFFVFLTDKWHLFNAVQYTSFILAIVLYQPLFNWWIDAILLKCAFTITFEVFYKWVLVKK